MSDQGKPVIELELQTRLGRLSAKVPVPPQGIRLSEVAMSVMGVADQLVEAAIKSEAAQGKQVSCRKHCGACCRQAVPVSVPEAFMITEVVMSMPPDRRAVVLSRFEQALKRLEREGFGQRSLMSGASMDEVQKLGLDYFRLGLACPFLEDESCSIYAQRPSACREYLVTSPASFCSDPGANPIVPVPIGASLTEALSNFAASVLGGPPFVLPLVTALSYTGDGPGELFVIE
jgi:Fe-S-cluster containining protein